jgi:mono/diheme cytochrome c family protein
MRIHMIAAAAAGLLVAFAPAGRRDRAVAPTFAKQIAPILYSRCASCHRPGEGAPFSLLTYADARKRATQIAAVTKMRLMPPWKAESDCAFRDDQRLSEAQIDAIRRWAEAGAPEGKPSDLPRDPAFTDGWQLGTPDLVVKMPKAFTVRAEGPDIYRTFVLPTHLPKDTWVRAIDFRPGARSVVHHSLFFFETSGEARKRDGLDGQPGFNGGMGGGRGGLGLLTGGRAGAGSGSLGGWAVGAQAVSLPDGLAYFLPANADILLSTHFHPSGKVEQEQSALALYFAKSPPQTQFTGVQMPPLFGALAGLDIPAGDSSYTIQDDYTLPTDVKAFGVSGHAHYLARDMKMTATLPDGTTKTLLAIPDWDFSWQGQYLYRDYVPLPKGTKLHTVIRYDNSSANPRNPTSPPKRVRWGEQSTDEMGSVSLRLIANSEADLAALQTDYRNHIKDAITKRFGIQRQGAGTQRGTTQAAP